MLAEPQRAQAEREQDGGASRPRPARAPHSFRPGSGGAGLVVEQRPEVGRNSAVMDRRPAAPSLKPQPASGHSPGRRGSGATRPERESGCARRRAPRAAPYRAADALDVGLHLAGVLVAPLGLALERPQHDLVEPHVDLHRLRRRREAAAAAARRSASRRTRRRASRCRRGGRRRAGASICSGAM